MQSIMDAARNLVEDNGGVRALAPRIDKNETTLAHELTETGSAKLGLVTAVKLSKRTGDLRILNAIAAEMGCMVLVLPDALRVEGDATMHNLAAVAKEFSEVVGQVSASCGDGQITENELKRIEREWGELLAAGQQLMAGLRAQHESEKPESLRVVRT